MSYVNKRPYCSFEHVFIGSLVVELLLLFALFSLIKSEQKSLFLQRWELGEYGRVWQWLSFGNTIMTMEVKC